MTSDCLNGSRFDKNVIQVKIVTSVATMHNVALSNFQYDHEHKMLHACDCQLNFELIWNNYVDIQQENIQVKVIIITPWHCKV